jgi:RNA polymerase sigma factor (sigma-70 family)
MTKGQEHLSVTDPPGTVAELYQLQRLPMARLAFVLTGSSSFADEIVQEAFLKVHVNWASIENPGGYLRTAVVNGCRSYHRHQAVLERTPLSPPVHATLVHRELDDALAKLPYRRRAALALRYFCDLPDSEIAVALDVRPATVRSLIHRGLADLRKEITP